MYGTILKWPLPLKTEIAQRFHNDINVGGSSLCFLHRDVFFLEMQKYPCCGNALGASCVETINLSIIFGCDPTSCTTTVCKIGLTHSHCKKLQRLSSVQCHSLYIMSLSYCHYLSFLNFSSLDRLLSVPFLMLVSQEKGKIRQKIGKMYNTRFQYFSRSYDKDKDHANGINSIIK